MTDDTNNDDLIGWIIDLLDYKAGFKGELLRSDKDSFFLDKLCTLIKSNNDKIKRKTPVITAKYEIVSIKKTVNKINET